MKLLKMCLFTTLLVMAGGMTAKAQTSTIIIHNNSTCPLIVRLYEGNGGPCSAAVLHSTHNIPAGNNTGTIVSTNGWWFEAARVLDPAGSSTCSPYPLFDIGDNGLCQPPCIIPNVMQGQMDPNCGCPTQPQGIVNGNWTCTWGNPIVNVLILG